MMFGPNLTGRDREPGSPRPKVRLIALAIGLLAAGMALGTEQYGYVGITLISILVATIF